MSPANIDRLGKLLFGPRYTGQLVAALTEVGPHKAHAAHVSGWVAGTRPIPKWVSVQARQVAVAGHMSMLSRCAHLMDMVADPTSFQHDSYVGEEADDEEPTP